jgi:hypothetical protein
MTQSQAMRTSSPRFPRLAVSALVAALVGCATSAPPRQAPPPPMAPVLRQAPPPPQPVEVTPPGPTINLLCQETVRKIPFEGIGIPRYSQILDIALTPDRVWLLVSPTHLVELWRDPADMKFRTVTGREDAAWGALDVDPLDGSLWIVSSVRLELIHIVPDGTSRVVKIQRLEGQGGFRDVLVDESGIWVVPTCAENALWKIDRTGKVLQQEFRRAGTEPLTLRESFTPEESQGSITGCIPVSLARDSAGRIALFDGASRSFYRREEEDWRPFLELPEPAREALPSGGVRVDLPGTDQETWAPASGWSGDAPAFFFAGDTPFFQPSVLADLKTKGRRVYYIRYERSEPAGVSTAFERCSDLDSFVRVGTVASDPSGYVAAFGTSLLLGSFPDQSQEPAAEVPAE